MTFLQPILLLGLPLVALPILIHLINKWRHRTIPWGAMMFLLDAKRLTRGMARLRFWLIMLMRMLAIAGLFIAVARPLSSGWLGTAIGAQADTTIILLDRSASMEQQDVSAGRSKREEAISVLASMFDVMGTGSRVVLIESTERSSQEIEAESLSLELPETSATATTADLPGLLQEALEYVGANQAGTTDIWICSDARQNDWLVDDGRWVAIREGFQRFQGVRFYLLTYSQPARDNIAVRVSNVRQRSSGYEQELLLDVSLRREAEDQAGATVPVTFDINGARSVVNLELEGDEFTLQGHKISLDESSPGGWGRVEIPTDENPTDNVFYFAFSTPPAHLTTIVCEDIEVARPLEVAATAPLDPSVSYSATVLSLEEADQIDWSASSLILWQAPFPEGALAEQLAGFVRGGRPVIFFPTQDGGENPMFGLSWGEWRSSAGEQHAPIASWRNDADLLANAQSGESLAVGKLRTYRYRTVRGNGQNALARFDDGAALLTRATTADGPAYFCGTLPVMSYSSLAHDGLAFYAMIQRALAMGAATQGNARQLPAGTAMATEVDRWQPATEWTRAVPLSARWVNAGVYENGERWLALNRPADEEVAPILAREELDRLLSGLDVRHVEKLIGESGSLASEIWRAFYVLMGTALFAEALLCLPERKVERTA